MARMIPEDPAVLEEMTEGERKVLFFLTDSARPHSDYMCWVKPMLRDREADLVFFSQRHGLLVIEVKDWAVEQIRGADPHQVTLCIDEHEEKHTNPDRQAKGYVDALKATLEGIPEFLSRDIRYEGRLKIPIGRMTAFPHITHEEMRSRGLHRLFPPERTLYKEDLDPAGEIARDTSGETFSRRIERAFPFSFEGLDVKERKRLSAAVFPTLRLDLPSRHGESKKRFRSSLLYLDERQAKLALRLRRGHQILKGPPGSGKTLILVHRCCHLYRYDPFVNRILVVCYNIALSSYIKRLIQEKGLGTAPGQIHVRHFFELCSEILEEDVKYEGEDSDYYDLVVQETWEKVRRGDHPMGLFDAVLIDEGQDLSNEMLRILLKLVRPDGDFVLALDPYQDIYRTGASWKSLGIQAQGRTRYLGSVYRNTREIFEFTQRFIGEEPRDVRSMGLLAFDALLHGPLPELRRFEDEEKMWAYLVEDIQGYVRRSEYRRSEIAVIYDDKVYTSEGFTYSERKVPI